MILINNLGLKENVKLYQAIADRLLDSLSYIRFIPQRILEFGTVDSHITKQLTHIYTNSEVYSLVSDQHVNINSLIKNSLNQNKFFYSHLQKLPLLENSIDLIISNLTINCVEPSSNIKIYFKEMHRVINNNGVILFAMLNVKLSQGLQVTNSTLNEETDNLFNNNLLIAMGNLLLLSNFADPVIDRELITINYQQHAIQTEIIYGHAVGKKVITAPIEIEVC